MAFVTCPAHQGHRKKNKRWGMDKDFQAYAKVMAARQTQKTGEDYHRELTGDNDARINRFSVGESPRLRTEREEDERKRLSALQTLLRDDPQYRAAYDRISGFLDGEAADIVDALTKNTAETDIVEAAIKDNLAKAVTLSDGTRIFRDSQTGEVETEHGRALEPHEYEHIIFPPGAPELGTYKANKARLAQLQKERAELIHYQTQVIDPAQAKIDEQSRPLTIEEMEELEQQVLDAKPDVMKPHNNKANMPQPKSMVSELDMESFKM